MHSTCLQLSAIQCTVHLQGCSWRENTEQQKFNLSTPRWLNILKPVGGENRRFKVRSPNRSPSGPEYEFHTQPKGDFHNSWPQQIFLLHKYCFLKPAFQIRASLQDWDEPAQELNWLKMFGRWTVRGRYWTLNLKTLTWKLDPKIKAANSQSYGNLGSLGVCPLARMAAHQEDLWDDGLNVPNSKAVHNLCTSPSSCHKSIFGGHAASLQLPRVVFVH